MENSKDMHEEIDLAEVARGLWARRRFIARVTAVAVALGLVAALFGEVRYTSSTVIVPQMGQKASGGGLQGLAAMAGIDLGSAQSGELVSPMVYPMVAGSVPFARELMNTEVTVERSGERVTLIDYFTVGGYRRLSPLQLLKKYTLGLPALILKAVRGDKKPAARTDAGEGIETLSTDEHAMRRTLAGLVSVAVNDKNGYITLAASMPEALMSAQVVARARELLQEYVTRFKLEKAQAGLDFVEARYRESRTEFETRQRALATFQDANQNITSALARTRESQLRNEYDLAFAIYSELARQREQASIKVKEDTPIFTVVEPVTVPVERSAPRRAVIVVASLLLGLFAGIGLALVLPWLRGIFGRGGAGSEELI